MGHSRGEKGPGSSPSPSRHTAGGLFRCNQKKQTQKHTNERKRENVADTPLCPAIRTHPWVVPPLLTAALCRRGQSPRFPWRLPGGSVEHVGGGRQMGRSRGLGSGLPAVPLQELTEQPLHAQHHAGGTTMAQAQHHSQGAHSPPRSHCSACLLTDQLTDLGF